MGEVISIKIIRTNIYSYTPPYIKEYFHKLNTALNA